MSAFNVIVSVEHVDADRWRVRVDYSDGRPSVESVYRFIHARTDAEALLLAATAVERWLLRQGALIPSRAFSAN